MSTKFRSILVSAPSGAGKSWSLKDIRGQEGVLYLNSDGGKPLPFKNKFKSVIIDDPYEVHDIIKGNNKAKKYHLIIIDTISFLMDRFESYHIVGAANTMEGWGKYGNFYRDLMNDFVAKSTCPVIFLGHLDIWTDENSGDTVMSVPVKGALRKVGLESFFTTVISGRKIKLRELTKNKLLNITDRDRELGYKHVFQTRTTKKTVGDRIRSPDALFSDDELYIDNNMQVVIDRLSEYYSDED